MSGVTRLAFALLAVAATVYTFFVPPADGFREPDLARILLWHLPCALIASALIFVAAWHGLWYLRKGENARDWRLRAATELGVIFALLTMATGILFSRVQWGAWWQWDPRQTSFLMVLFLLAAAMAIRWSFPEGLRQARAAAGYSLAMLVPAIFLIFVYPRLPQVLSFHPSDTISSGQLDGSYWFGVLLSLAALWLAAALLTRRRVAQLAAEHRMISDDMGNRGGAAASGVGGAAPLLPQDGDRD